MKAGVVWHYYHFFIEEAHTTADYFVEGFQIEWYFVFFYLV